MRISDWSSDVCSSDLSSKAARGSVLSRRDDYGRRLSGRTFPEIGKSLHPHNFGAILSDIDAAGDARPFELAWRLVSLGLPLSPARQGRRAKRGRNNPQALVRQAQGHWRNEDRKSEEHTSELQSLMRSTYAVFCLKKKKK